MDIALQKIRKYYCECSWLYCIKTGRK